MSDDDQLHHLGDGTELETSRPLGEIQQRGHQLRRQRRVLAAGGAGVTVAAVVLASALVLPGSRGNGVDTAGQLATQPTAQPTDPGSDQDGGSGACVAPASGGNARVLSPKEASDVLYLPTQSFVGKVTSVRLVEDRTDCTGVVNPVTWYATELGDRVTRTFWVAGPNVASIGSLQAGTRLRVTQFRTGMGYLLVDPKGTGLAQWTVDGVRWTAQSEGLTVDELRAAVNAVQFRHGQPDPGSAVPGLDQQAPTLGGREVLGRSIELGADVKGPAGLTEASFYVVQPGDETFAPNVGEVVVSLDGKPAYLSPGVQGIYAIRWQLADGVYAAFSSRYPLTNLQLIWIAQHTRAIPDDDPIWDRLIGQNGPGSPVVPSTSASAPTTSPSDPATGPAEPTSTPTGSASATSTGWF